MMSDRASFERRLQAAFDRYAEHAPVDVDAAVLASAIVRARRTPVIGFWKRPLLSRTWLVPVLIVLLTLATAAAVFVGARLIDDQVRRPRVDLVFEPVAWSLQVTGALLESRSGATATLLADGRVLITGGFSGWPDADSGIVEAYDPVAGTFTQVGSHRIDRQSHAAMLLEDGRVLISGGSDEDGNVLASAELFDPATGTFSRVGDMSSPRYDHATVLLDDGRVALIGGRIDLGPDEFPPPPVELFDPATGTFSAGPRARGLDRSTPVAVKLSDGRIVVAGPDARDIVIFDPRAGTSSLVDIPPGSIDKAVQLDDGRLLVAGAGGAAILDPVSGSLAALPRLPGRVVLEPAVLADGRVLLTLFDADACGELSAVVLDVGDGSFTALGALPGVGGCNGVSGTTVTRLANGDVLLAGGNNSGGLTTDVASLVSSSSGPGD